MSAFPIDALPSSDTPVPAPGPGARRDKAHGLRARSTSGSAPAREHPDPGRSAPRGRPEWTPKGCPRCGNTEVTRFGSFRTASGSRVPRYRCRACGRTFSRNTGTPAYRVQKQDAWQAMIDLLAESLPLRRIASRLKISVSTAFRWRHRALAVLHAQDRKQLSGDVRVECFLVKYSEKGSRVCNGPGSWGYWNIVRKGAEPVGRVRPGVRPGRRRFRLLIDGRPLKVMIAETDTGYEWHILGQARRTPEMIGVGFAQLVRPGSRVFAFGGPEYRVACEALGYEHHDGIAAATCWRHSDDGDFPGATVERYGIATPGDTDAVDDITTPGDVASADDTTAPDDAGTADDTTTPGEAARGTTGRTPGAVRFPNLPTWWLRRFRGVATKYLGHYLAWFRDIIRIVDYPDGGQIAAVDGRALLRSVPC